MTFVTPDGRAVCTPFRPDLAAVIPHARRLLHDGQPMLVFPNRTEEAKVARNLGVDVPPPIFTSYDWCGTRPWDVQKITAAMLVENPRAYVLNTMGTGKTRAAIFAADYLLRTTKLRKVLIAAPLSTLTPVWEQEIFAVAPKRRFVVLHGTREKRLKLLGGTPVSFYIINHHGLHMLRNELAEAGFEIVVVDELAVLRNKQTQLWKAACTLIDKAQFAWGLTGSPTPQSPTDAWAQMRLLTPGRTTRSFSQFQDITMRRISQFRWIARPEANEIVHQQMQPAVRYTRDDVAELPPTTFVDRHVAQDPEAARAYKLLFDRMRATTDMGKSITAVNEGVLHNKLLQVACGYIYTDDHTVHELPHQGRLDALDDVIASTDQKLIVFVPYVHAIHGVAEYLRKAKHDVAVVHGGVSRGARDLIFNGFQRGTSPRIIVAHPGCMAHGLTLTKADTIVWYAPIQSLELYEQANARIVRPGQTRKTFIVHLHGTVVERLTYTRLKARAKMQGTLLELFRNQDLEF